MRTIFAALLLSAISALAADTPVAIVKGTNVLGVAIADTNRFVPPAGASNVVVDLPLIGIVQKGWTYSGGVFRNPDRKEIAGADKEKVDRAKIGKAFKEIVKLRENNWDTLKVPEQGDVLGQMAKLLYLIVELHPELLEPKEPAQ